MSEETKNLQKSIWLDDAEHHPQPTQGPPGVQIANSYLILLVTDREKIADKIASYLEPFGYTVHRVSRPVRALEELILKKPDILLVDAEMERMAGYELCRTVKGNRRMEHIPIVMWGEVVTIDDKSRAYYVGADGFMTWPCHEVELRARVRSLVRVKLYHQRLRNEIRSLEAKLRGRTRELEQITMGLVIALEKANEFNDTDTGMHIRRVCHYSKILGEAHGFGPAASRNIFRYASLHDVGKVALPASILKKPGKLTAEEITIMRRHTTFGYNLLKEARADDMACEIALRHHEKWDGSGYPDGMAGDEIAIEARIVALVDVYDALTQRRCYKEAWPVEKALDYLRSESGKHFDPRLVELFIDKRAMVLEIQNEYKDDPGAEPAHL
ncbi:MAG: two-component system response regulator [Myxococcales bacterium]|nr:two-component system response regulator [Myxococcales bacterium]